MLKLILIFLGWVAVGTGVYFAFTPWALVAYGVLSMAGFLVWAANKK
jgi:hypothetical protein